MFGYATDETEECMPLTVVLAHKLNEKIADLRRSGELWWARPDTKTQVRFRGILAIRTAYTGHRPPNIALFIFSISKESVRFDRRVRRWLLGR